jgi:hypothetical protein
VIGFDISSEKISFYRKGVDVIHEIADEALKSTQVVFTDKESDTEDKEFYIVAVPTPLQGNNLPNLSPLQRASEIVGRNMKKDNDGRQDRRQRPKPGLSAASLWIMLPFSLCALASTHKLRQ